MKYGMLILWLSNQHKLHFKSFLTDPVVQRPPDNLTFEFPDNSEMVLCRVRINYELEHPFVLEFHGSSTNSTMIYDKDNKHVDDYEIIGEGS